MWSTRPAGRFRLQLDRRGQPVRRVPIRSGDQVAVEVHRDLDGRMPPLALDVGDRLAPLQEERGVRVAPLYRRAAKRSASYAARRTYR
jgi:hypothetical protein